VIQFLHRGVTVLWCLILMGMVSPRVCGEEFRITLDKKVFPQPVSGRILVVLSKEKNQQPPGGPSWFNPDPFFALDVKELPPGQAVVLDDKALGFPGPLTKQAPGIYWARAILDRDNSLSRTWLAEGNGYSAPLRVELHSTPTRTFDLRIDQIYHERPLKETGDIKLVAIESKLLSAFHGRPITMRAAVILPRLFAQESSKHYPVIYEIPGFGGSHAAAFYQAARKPTDVAGTPMLFVVLDPSCRLGHHVFADSDNNGPWGQALTEELIPFIENKFRAIGTPAARFVTGHSSGGWSSLWLQVRYPDFFGGVWSTSPDPIDFRDFQRINLYSSNANMFFDEAGKRRPLARMSGKPVLFFQRFSSMETVMGHGGQLESFEAVFSPRGPDGKPRRLWNRQTGKVDPEVARSWQRYDIRLVLEQNWPALAPRLAGKLHVYTGSEDTFYLEGAVALLKDSLHRLGSDAVVEIIPGKDHGNLLDASTRQRMAREMAEQFQKNYRAAKPAS
jgi:pimeloyl-ACP methyl ester carboxylesterase